MLIIDSQKALAFLVPQLASIEKEVYKVKYSSIRYRGLVPIDTSANPWAPSIVFYSSDSVGQAAWYNGKAQDVPNVAQTRSQFNTSIKMAALGYSWNAEEIAQASMLNINLNADKATDARRIAEEFVDGKALFGDAEVRMTGLFNNGDVTVVPCPTVAGNTALTSKAPAEVLADVNGLLTGIYTGSSEVEMADTLLLPVAVWSYLATTPFNAYSETTLLGYIARNNVYTAETGEPLTIRGIRGLEAAGVGGTGRAVAYRRDPTVVKMHMPMPYRFLPVWQKGPLEYEVPGILRIGGVDVRRPGAFRYMDGV